MHDRSFVQSAFARLSVCICTRAHDDIHSYGPVRNILIHLCTVVSLAILSFSLSTTTLCMSIPHARIRLKTIQRSQQQRRPGGINTTEDENHNFVYRSFLSNSLLRHTITISLPLPCFMSEDHLFQVIEAIYKNSSNIVLLTN